MDQRYVPLTFSADHRRSDRPGPGRCQYCAARDLHAVHGQLQRRPVDRPVRALPAPTRTTSRRPSARLSATGSIGSASLTWTAATDNFGVTGYDVYRSTGVRLRPRRAANRSARPPPPATRCGPLRRHLLLPGDRRGCRRQRRPRLELRRRHRHLRHHRPTVSITNPADGTTVSGAITLAANAADDVGVAGVQFSVDGVPFGAEDTARPLLHLWNSTSVSNGSHTISARARDAANNATNTPDANVTVSNVVVPSDSSPRGVSMTPQVPPPPTPPVTPTTAPFPTPPGPQPENMAARWRSTASTVGSPSPTTTPLDLTNAMTLEAWIKPNSLNGWTDIIMKERTAGLAYALYASDDTNKPPAGYIYRGADISAVGTSPSPGRLGSPRDNLRRR